MRDIQLCITKEEFKSKKVHSETRETVKAEFLGGDPKILNLIEDSVYENKHVHYTSMVSEELNQFVNEKQFLNAEMGKIENLR